MRLCPLFLLLLLADGVVSDIHAAQETSSLLELSSTTLPPFQAAPFILTLGPALLLGMGLFVSQRTQWAIRAAFRIVNTLRRITHTLILQPHERVGTVFFATWNQVALILSFHVLAAMLTLAASAWAFGFPVPSWAESDIFSKLVVCVTHISLSVTIGCILLFLQPYIFERLLRIRQYSDTAPNTSVTAAQAFRILEEYSTPQELLEHPIKQNSTTKTAPQQTFEEWSAVKDSDVDDADPLRVLIRFFHPTVMVTRTRVAELKKKFEKLRKTDTNVPLLGVTALLKLAFEYRSAFSADRTSQKTLELKQELLPHIKVVWASMKKELHARHKDKDDPLHTVFLEGLYMGAWPISVTWVVEQVLQTTAVSTVCPSLVNNDNSVVQGRIWHLKSDTTYPPIPNAQSWQCPGSCTLMCDVGYVPVHGYAQCITWGGGGSVWSHLNDMSANIAACCIDDSNALVLRSFSLNTEGTLTFAANQTFSIGCGVNQSLAVQVCTDTSTELWQQEGACDAGCRFDPSGTISSTATECQTIWANNVFPTATWQTLYNGSLPVQPSSVNQLVTVVSSVEIGAIPALKPSTLHRIVYRRVDVGGVHVAYGPWQSQS